DDELLYNNATGTNGVPYPKNYSYRHPYRATYIADDLSEVLRQFKPTRVFTTHPRDTHPDHRATANFVQLALLQLEAEGLRPVVDFYLIHFANWPTPLFYHPTVILEPPPALQNESDWMVLPLTPTQVERKYQATLTNLTQVANQQPFLTAFARANEIFTSSRIPVIPLLPAQSKLDWEKALHLQAPTVWIAQSGYESNGIAVLPPVAPVFDLEAINLLQQNDALVAQVEFKHLSNQRGGVRWFLFGYRQGTDFADLPKVQITILPDRQLQVVVNHEAIEDSGVNLTGAEPRLILHVPLKLLGGADIDHLFTAAIAYLGATVTDDTAWHLLRFPDPKD
ncbi:MAG: PIG-L family deacetylase, partial [Verrucomicrobiota bacterium]